MTLLEVTEYFCRLSRITKRFEILSQNFEVTSAESLNHAYDTKRARFKMTKINGIQVLAKYQLLALQTFGFLKCARECFNMNSLKTPGDSKHREHMTRKHNQHLFFYRRSKSLQVNL